MTKHEALAQVQQDIALFVKRLAFFASEPAAVRIEDMAGREWTRESTQERLRHMRETEEWLSNDLAQEVAA